MRPPRRVALCSGHMIDQPDRATPRFPASREGFVAAAIAETLASWNLGPSDLAICGGARGADILFAEAAIKCGATLRILLAEPEADFRRNSLQLGTSDLSWEHRFDDLRKRGATICNRQDRFGDVPAGVSIYEQTNRWMLDTAVDEADDEILAVIVWDGEGAGDGPGGTAGFQRELLTLGCTPVVIDPRP